jgi:hypothetical protein
MLLISKAFAPDGIFSRDSAKGNGPLAIQYYGCCVVDSYHEERNHQGKQNTILFPVWKERARKKKGAIHCRERLGGLLKYYEPEAA